MYNIPSRKLDSRLFSSNTNTMENSVDNIIKKYSKLEKQIPHNNNNPYERRHFEIYDSTPVECTSNNFTNYNIDSNLYNFITNYCREEIKKEIHSKLSENNVQDSVSIKKEENSDGQTNRKECSDKSTYCRPMLNLYNQEFIYKTIEKNARLTRLAKKLVAAHKRQMHNEAWNNFINELKNKHGRNNIRTQRSPDIDMIPAENSIWDDKLLAELIDNCCSTKHAPKHSNLCRNLLDIYENLYNSDIDQNKHSQETLCYPTSSLGRLVILQKAKERLARKNTFGRHSTNNISNLNENRAMQRQNVIFYEPFPLNHYKSSISKRLQDTEIQTNLDECLLHNTIKIRDCATEISHDIIKPHIEPDNSSKPSPDESQNDIKELSLKHIENKLETIMESINNFMKELKPKKKSKGSRHNACINMICRECHNVKTELAKNYKEELFDSEKYNSSDSILHINDMNSALEKYDNNSDITKLNEIFTKELGDNNNTNRNRTCAVQIAFEEPTRERSTEVTKSLSQTGKNFEENVEEIIVPDIHENDLNNMTIAVNTDPLSFLALLKISTEAMKRLLSYMPNFDYYYYLSRLQFPQLQKSLESNERQFICNICGANFKKPSELNDHIQEHDLGEARNCCVCRHVLENLSRTTCLFSCRYCGQCFTRAYCCELHQETCAKRLGKRHDVDSDLLLLT